MDIITHPSESGNIAEIKSDNVVIHSLEDALDMLGNLYYNDFGKVILYRKNLPPEFFDLSTKLAGDVLQKFSNYRVRLVIVGDFSENISKSLSDFIFESNRGTLINFVRSPEEAIDILSKH